MADLMYDYDYDEMTVAELEALNVQLMAEKATVRLEQRKLAAALDEKRAQQAAAERVEKMDPTERAALAQALSATGVASEEAFGEV